MTAKASCDQLIGLTGTTDHGKVRASEFKLAF